MASYGMVPTQRTALHWRISDLGAEVWRVLASRRLTIVALVVVLMVSVAGFLSSSSMSPLETQVPGYQGTASLLPLVRGEEGAVASRLAGVGLGALSALSLVRVLQAWVIGWGAAAPRDVVVRLHEVPWDVDEAWREAEIALSVAGLRLERGGDRGDTRVGLARRPGLARGMRGALYLGVLLIVTAGLVARWWGWAGEPFDLALGETRGLGPRGEVVVRLEQLEVVPGTDRSAIEVASTLAVMDGDGAGRSFTVEAGRRVRVADLALYQLGHGPAARVVARDDAGNALPLQSMALNPAPRTVARISFSGRQQEHLLAVPQANLVVRLVHYPSLATRGIAGPVLHVRVERGIDGLSLAEEFLTEGRSLSVDGVTLDIAFEYYVVMRAAREPHLPLAALGALLVLLGVMGAAAWPERRAWVAVRAREGAEGPGSAHESRSFAATQCQLAVEPRDASAGWLAGAEAVLVERACGQRDDAGS